MQLSANGRNVVITGGSQGLGFACAKAYMEAGANVAILARRADVLEQARAELIRAGSGKVVATSCDVRSAHDLERAFADVAAALGPVDVLINNAGASSVAGFEDITDAMWQEDLDLKLFAAIRATRLVWSGMKERGFGRVINILNTYAKAPAARTAPTSVSRAAGMALTKVLAAEGAPHNILVNALLIGLIESEQTVRRHAELRPEISFAQFLEEYGARIPLRRLGRPEELSALALFLGSDAGSYITGTAINVDGGSCPIV